MDFANETTIDRPVEEAFGFVATGLPQRVS